MTASILKHEIKNRFSHWSIFLLYGLLIFQGIWYTKGTFDYYVNEDLLMNAAAVFYKNLAGGGILLIIIVAVLTGPILFKEIQHKTGQWLFTNPIDEKKFFLGRFFAAFSINSFVALGYIIGMLLVPYSGIGDSHQFGDAPFGQLMHGYFFLLLPNLLLLTSLVFFALVYFKKMAAGYLAVIITVIAFLLMQTTAESSGATPFLMIADPFGYVAVDNAIDFLSVEERNFGYLKFTNYLLYNRLFWVGLSVLLIFSAYRKFSFKGFLKTDNKGKSDKVANAIGNSVEKTNVITSENLTFEFGLKECFKKLFSLSILEIKNVVRPSGFKVILGIVVLMNILQNLLWNASYYIGPTEPLTFTMTQFRLSYGIFIMILLMVWSVELFFKDRTVNFWQIADALPVPVWTITLSRFIAMSVVAFILAFTFMCSGIFVQTITGGTSLIDLKLYAYDILGYNWGWLTYVLQISLVFFIAGLTKNRIATHIISVGILFITILSFELGLAEQTIYAFAAVPGLEDYSEVSGYGIWTMAAKWYFLMWALLGACFILTGIWFWQRGSKSSLSSFSIFNKQLSWAGKISLAFLLIGFVATKLHIINEVNGKGNFELSETEEHEQADYEKKYSYLKSYVHPKYKMLDLKFDFYPDERKAVYIAEITLSNNYSSDTLYLNWSDFIDVQKLSIAGKELSPIFQDTDLKISAYLISNKSDSVLNVTIQAQKQYIGFTQGGEDPQPDLMFNGSFGSIKDFLPTIGYDYDRELNENRKRADYGLPKLTSRMASLDDSIALSQDAFSPDADWVKGKIEISTIENQTVIAPGNFIKSCSEKGRTYSIFEILKPQPFNWYLGSAEYGKAELVSNDVTLEIYHDPKHLFNVELYKEAATKAIQFVSESFGEFPSQQIRIYEIPYYQKPFYSFPNAIAISEKEGWYAKTDAMKERAYIYQTVSSQIIKQWIQSHISVANVQGADMLRVALPEALALTFVEKELGKDATDIMLKKKSDKYAKDKNSEANQEPALIYADGADYLEANKGAVEIFKLIKQLGINEFIQSIYTWNLAQSCNVTFLSLIEHLRFSHNEMKVENFEKK
ncbi:ABC transporter permease [Arthrospiribacter ruber]|uniref:ABC-2 family transporter protein n=1 Tax=Arthrospiribacter ruber TaxID=2487934 RepID=A0A951IZ76_9BACT|nr:hypothetical protein [Arthrospiribacter ruber]MBW3469558.1 hypothetical protein [Arthrospiribacter ruber]